MKTLSLLCVLAGMLLTGCGSNELSKEEARQLLSKEPGYPRVYDHDVFCGNPKHAKDILDKGLEAQGLVIVHRTAKLKDIGKKPIIEFTDKGKAYFLPTPEEDWKHKIQKVKLADEEILQVTSIISDAQNKTAIVNYTTTYKNLTPFAVLVKNLKVPERENTATFALTDDGNWTLQK